MNLKHFMCVLGLAILLASCRKEPQPLPEKVTSIPADPGAVVKGFYLVNEGNMNMNKASLDYVDLTTGMYRLNIYGQVNPEVTKGLGDVGNDIALYGAKLYVVVNVSNKIEVLHAKSGKRIGQIAINNCRYITFKDGKGYVSSYAGNPNNSSTTNGMVAEIDTANLIITRTVEVGRQPEEMAIVNKKLYVANSGGYSPPNYESTVSVIDLTSFKEIKKIEVAINLHRLKADRYGDLYITSRGDYYDISSKLIVLDTQTDQVKKTFDLPVSNLAIDDDVAYIYNTQWNYATGINTVNYLMIDVKNETLMDRKFITDGTDKNIVTPYGIAVNHANKDVYVTDAKDYVSPGKLYCYNFLGKLKWSITTGDIPAHLAFTN